MGDSRSLFNGLKTFIDNRVGNRGNRGGRGGRHPLPSSAEALKVSSLQARGNGVRQTFLGMVYIVYIARLRS